MSDNNSGAPASNAAVEAAPAADEAVDQSLDNAGQEGAEGVPSEAQIDANPNLTKSEKKEAKKALKSLKIKYNGKEYEEALPFEIPDDEDSKAFMVKHLQMSKMSQSKAQEQAALEREVREFITELKKNPRKILADPTIGIDVKKLAAEIIEEEINNSQKSPEQLEKEKIEAELKALKEEREREKEDFKKKEFERLQAQELERYDMLMTKALEKSELPKSPYVVKKMADYMLLGLQQGLDVKPEDVLPIVKDEIIAEIKDMFGVMPEEVIENIIGKDVFTKIRKKNVAKLKASKEQINPQKPAAPKTESEQKESKKDGSKKTFKDFFGV